jgi:hypothetical protein
MIRPDGLVSSKYPILDAYKWAPHRPPVTYLADPFVGLISFICNISCLLHLRLPDPITMLLSSHLISSPLVSRNHIDIWIVITVHPFFVPVQNCTDMFP